MKLSEIKKLEPEATLHEIQPNVQYILNVPSHMPMDALHFFRAKLVEAGLTKILVVAGDFKLYALEQKPSETVFAALPLGGS